MSNLNRSSRRSVLVLNLSNEMEGLELNLNRFNWNSVKANSLLRIINVIKQKNIWVAIAIISNSGQKKSFDIIDKLKKLKHDIYWIAISIENPVATSCSSKFPEYFIDYYHLPIEWSKLAHSLGHAHGMAALKYNNAANSVQHDNENTKIGQIIFGRSEQMSKLKRDMKKVSLSDSAVLISGETGTGKGLSASYIHSLSRRAHGPLVTVNCGALPASLIHSELFGHEKGAFTGAEHKYIGHIERADKGTLFFDEIGDLPLELQVNFLQFIEENTIERLGGTQQIKVDCRILVASHIDLDNAVAEGRFREDLYHRLNILRIHVPSLREHREDIELLAYNYLELYNNTEHNFYFSTSALETMFCYDWPGNVRELKNRVLRAIAMAESNEISEVDLGIKINSGQSLMTNLAQHRVEIDTEVLLDSIKRNNHNISAAARELNISRTTVYRLMKKCNIKL